MFKPKSSPNLPFLMLTLVALFHPSLSTTTHPHHSAQKHNKVPRHLDEEETEEDAAPEPEALFLHKGDEDLGKEQEGEVEDHPKGKSSYEDKIVEFLDEVNGQFYLEAISFEDRYWLDFYNLLSSVKGRSILAGFGGYRRGLRICLVNLVIVSCFMKIMRYM